MKRIPRNKVIDIVVSGHVDDIENWVIEGDRESLRNWLYCVLELGRKTVENIKEEYSAYFSGEEEDE
jgi:hypothetical protein